MLCLMFAELSSTAGLGPVTAIGVAVTFLVMVTLLPALLVICGRWIFWPKRPDLRLARAHQHRHLGQGGPTDRRAPADGLGGHHGRSCCVACLGLFRLDANGLATDEQYTKDFDSVMGQRVLIDHGLVDTSNPIMVVANADKAADSRRRPRGCGGARATLGAGDQGRRRLLSRLPSPVTSPPRRPSTRSRQPATPSTRSTAPTLWSVASPRSTSTPRSLRRATTS